MRSCSGDVPATAKRDEEPCPAALTPDPVGRTPTVHSAPLTLSLRSKPSVVKALSLICGGSPLHSETNDPRGYSAPPCDEGDYPRDNPLLGKSSMTLSQRCSGTADGLPQTVSGVTSHTTTHETNDPRGYSAPPSVIEVHPRGEPLPDQSLMTLSQRCMGTADWIQNPACGGTTHHPMPAWLCAHILILAAAC